MKKIAMILLCCILIPLFCFFTCGCSPEDPSGTSEGISEFFEDPSASVDEGSESYPIVYMYGDWLVYSNTADLINGATNIYSGKVVDVSFAIIDMTNGKKVDNPDDAGFLIYAIQN